MLNTRREGDGGDGDDDNDALGIERKSKQLSTVRVRKRVFRVNLELKYRRVRGPCPFCPDLDNVTLVMVSNATHRLSGSTE